MVDPNGTKGEATVSRLMSAAVEAFSEKGFHATTTRDIAAAAGMSAAAMYAHLKSKEELLYLISRAGHDTTRRIFEEETASSADPTEQLAAVMRGFAIHHASDHTSARVVNYELAALSPEHHQEIREIRRAIETAAEDLVQRGVTSGAFRTSKPRMAAVALLSLGIDIARWYRDDGTWSPEDIGEYYADLALRIVAARSVTDSQEGQQR